MAALMDSTPLSSVPFRKPAHGRIRKCLPTQVLAAPPWPYPSRSVDPADNRSEVREFLPGMGVTRRLAALGDLRRRAGKLPEVEAIILIGSVASDTADAVSDVDAIVIVREF
jgi:hypothetical protein